MSMEASEIIRRNVAIATYMRLDIRKNRDTNDYEIDPDDLPHAEELSWLPISELPYSKYWDFLMPVVEKIMKQYSCGYHITTSNKRGYACKINGPMVSHGKTPLGATFIAVSDYCLSLKQ